MSRLFVIALLGLGMAYPCMAAAEAPRPDAAKPGDAKAQPQAQRRQMSPQEWAERSLARIRESDPNKARELDALRKTDPNAFAREMGNYWRERMKSEGFDWSLLAPGDGGMPGVGGPGGGPGGPGPFGDRGMGGDPRAMMEKERDEFMKWMKVNYPEEEKKLAEIKKTEKDPAKVDRATMQHFRQYITIYVASKYNPKLAEILKQDLPLRNERRTLVASIDKATDPAEKAKLTEKLRGVVAKRFDLLVQQKQIEYDILADRLSTLQKQIDESKTRVEEMKKNSQQHIDKQMTDLLAHKDRPQDRPTRSN
jgi:hypothetical protein